MLSDTRIRELLAASETVAVVGANDSPGRASDLVGRYLVAAGYRVIPIHPHRAQVWGLQAYPSLAQAPMPIDLVDLFRASEHVPGHARECLSLNPQPLLFWMQLGVTSPEAVTLLAQSSLDVVEDRCLMVEHRRLMGRV